MVDAVRPDWLLADMLSRMKVYSGWGVPAYWVFEHAEWIGAAMSVFAPAADGGFDLEMSTREVFAATAPYPVTVDLPTLSNRWAQTFEYAERARILRDRSTPKPIHQSIGVDVAAAFKVNRPPGIVVSTDQSVMFDGHNERCPDVALIHEEGADYTPVLASDVFLAVEIVSPSSQVIDRVDKMKVYADGGISIYWIIDLLAERVTLTEFLLSSDGSYRQQVTTDNLVTMVRPWEVTVDLPSFTRQRDRIRQSRRAR